MLSVPIQAMAVRELIVRREGQHRPRRRTRKGSGGRSLRARGAAAELQAGPEAEGTEGVFVMRKDGKAEFVPVKTGIAGDKYFEVLSGLKDGDQVITGPFNVGPQTLKDGDEVKSRRPADRTRRSRVAAN